MSDETKYISLSELKVGMEIKGYKNGNTSTYYSADVVSIKNNTVELSWGEPLKNASDYMFCIKLTNEELKENISDIENVIMKQNMDTEDNELKNLEDRVKEIQKQIQSLMK